MSIGNKTVALVDIQVMQSFIDTMVGIERFSYPARQNGASKPEGEFAHIRLLEEYQVGIPNTIVTKQTNEVIERTIVSAVKLRFRVGVVDTTGIHSSKVMHGWTSEAMKELMLKTGYGFIRCTPLSNESAKLETEWEKRQGFSVELYSTRQYKEVLNTITGATVSGSFYDDALEEHIINIDVN